MGVDIFELQEVFYADRPAIRENNRPETLIKLFWGECKEFLHAFIDYLADPSEENRTEVEQESADVFLFLSAIAQAIGINLEHAVRGKVAYNSDRFRSKDFQTDYKGSYKRAKLKQGEIYPVYYPESV